MNARLLAIAGLVALASCSVPNDASVRIFALCTPPEPTDGGMCVYSATCDSIWLDSPVADVSSTSQDGPLVWPVQVDNQRPDNGDRSGGVNSADAWVEGYKISYSTSGLPAVTGIPSVDVTISRHPVLASGSTVVIAPVVPASVGSLLDGRMADGDQLNVKAELKAYGHYGDGSRFETGPFQVRATLVKNVLSAPSNDPVTGVSSACPDPAKKVYVGSCPQPLQSSIIHCIAQAQ